MTNLRCGFAVVSALLLSAPSLHADPVPITACGQQIVAGGGELTADLDCSGNPLAVGVSVIRGKLYLNGHSIAGAEIGVACVDSCAIYGPGTISGNGTGVDQFSTRSGGKVIVSDASVTGNAALGVGGDRVLVVRSTVTGNGGRVFEGSTVGGGIFASRRLVVRDSTVDGNFTYGVCSPDRIRVNSSTVQGNGTAPGCDPDPECGACGDLVSSRRPKASPSSTCDLSVNPPSATWGVCSSDPAP